MNTHIRIYFIARSYICASSVKEAKKGFSMNSITAVMSMPKTAESIIPLVTVLSALSCSFLPRLPAMSTFTPTPTHMERAIIRVVSGKASDTAASASSLIHETNMQSTKLYAYCMNMDMRGGTDIDIISGSTGFASILFTVCNFSAFVDDTSSTSFIVYHSHPFPISTQSLKPDALSSSSMESFTALLLLPQAG